MGLVEISKQKEKDSLEMLEDRLVDLNKKKSEDIALKVVGNSDYDEINVISFKRSLYRLKTNYKVKDKQKVLA